jgi:hypothetical protein
MKNDELLGLIQERLAAGSIPISTVRNMGPIGTMQCAQKFLCKPSVLLEFSTADTFSSFHEVLDLQTESLRLSLPLGENKDGTPRGQHWGCARKCLNIFLLECVLNRYICDHYDFGKIEPWLEVPLDSFVGNGLAKEKENRIAATPLWWDAVIRLSKERSDQYQELARIVANRLNIFPVQLDLYYYRTE